MQEANPKAKAFISSFSQEVRYGERRDSPLWKLRERLHELNTDSKWRSAHGEKLTWVERPTGALSPNDNLAVADRLIGLIKSCKYYVCILADDRRGTREHGTPILHNSRETAVTFFEIELYAAAMLRKRPFVFVLEGFDPGPRLSRLLKLLSWAFPEWRTLRPQNADDIFHGICELLNDPFDEPSGGLPRLVKRFYTERIDPFVRVGRYPKALFLDGLFESGPLPNKDRIEEFINEYRNATNYQQKATRLWLSVRELMKASYRSEDVQADSKLREFLPLWDCVLSDWAGVASWQGWHGHLFAGTIAPLNSQVIVRAQLSDRDLLPAEFSLPPDGALASAYYNVAKITGTPFAFRPLLRAGRHVKRAIETRRGPLDNLLAIRGSIRLRLGNWPGAVSDFKEMLRVRQKAKSSPQKHADALMHLGSVFLFWPAGRKASDYLSEAVSILEHFPDDPNLPRARRKLAKAQRIAGRISDARANEAKAKAEATRQGALDQIP